MQGLRIFSMLGGAPSADEIDAAHRVAATHKEMGHGVIRQTDAKTGVTVEYHAYKRVAMTSRVGGLWFSGATGLTNPNGAAFFVDWTNPSNHSAGKSLYISSSAGFSTSVTMTANPVSYAPPQSWSGDGFYYTIDGGPIEGGGSLVKHAFEIDPLSRFPVDWTLAIPDGIPPASHVGDIESGETPVIYVPTILFQSSRSAFVDGGTTFPRLFDLNIETDFETFFESFASFASTLNTTMLIKSQIGTSGSEPSSPVYGTLAGFIANDRTLVGQVTATNFPVGTWHATYLANGTWDVSNASFSVNDSTGVITYRGVTFTPFSHPSVYTDYIAARKAAADRHAAWCVSKAADVAPPPVSNAAPFQLQSIIDNTYGIALGGFRAGAPLTVVPVTKKVTSKYTGAVIGYMPAGMPVTFPATIEAESKALGFATMTYNEGLSAFVTQAWTTFESGDPPTPSPKTIGPSVVDVAFEATDLKTLYPPEDSPPDLFAQAKTQANLMQYTGVPFGFPNLGEFNETYRGAKEAVTGIPRPMKPWPPA